MLEYEHGVVPKPRWADLTDKDMTSQRAVASLATEDEEKAAMPLSEVRGASPKKERGGKKDSARGGKKKKAAFDLAAVVRQATEEEKSRQSADEESFGAGVLGSSDDECKPCLPSSASSDALARKQKTRSRWRFGAKLSGLNYRSSARRRTEGDEDDDRAGSEDERPSTAPARKSLGRAASDGGPTSASSDSHSSTWRKFSLSKLFAKHAPPGSDDDDGSPGSKAEGLTMSGMMRETEKRRKPIRNFCYRYAKILLRWVKGRLIRLRDPVLHDPSIREAHVRADGRVGADEVLLGEVDADGKVADAPAGVGGLSREGLSFPPLPKLKTNKSTGNLELNVEDGGALADNPDEEIKETLVLLCVQVAKSYAGTRLGQHGAPHAQPHASPRSSLYRYSLALVWLAVVVNHCVNANLLSLPLPLVYFLYGALEAPMPGPRCFDFLLTYVFIVLGMKFIYQLPLFCASPPLTMPTDQTGGSLTESFLMCVDSSTQVTAHHCHQQHHRHRRLRLRRLHHRHQQHHHRHQ